LTTEAKLFAALTVFVGVIVVAAVGYDIYLHPAEPQPLEKPAVIEISGTGRFHGVVGTTRRGGTYTIEGGAPATVKVPYALADFVVANVELPSGSEAGNVKIRVKGKTVKEGAGTLLVWRPPRGGN
jgi:hypothetical protein